MTSQQRYAERGDVDPDFVNIELDVVKEPAAGLPIPSRFGKGDPGLEVDNELKADRDETSDAELVLSARKVSMLSIFASLVLAIFGFSIGLSENVLSVLGFGMEATLDGISSALVMWRFKTAKQRQFEDAHAAAVAKEARDARRERNSAIGIGATFAASALMLCGMSVWKLFGWDPSTPEHSEEERSGAIYTSLLAWPSAAFVKVTSADLLKRFQNLLDKSHKSMCNYTRDRNWASGTFIPNTPVPTGYELVGAVRNENTALWRIYQVSKEVIRLDCTKPLKEAPFKTWTPLTMEAGKGLDWSDLDFCGDANEWLLFHASIPEALSAIARTGFTMAKLGSGGTTGGGGLYGDGTYFGDSITKADEYARRKVEHGEFKGCRAAAICRVLGGRHFYMDKDVQEKEKPKFAKRVLEGHYNSTVGDRLKVKNTFREYVAYDAASTYLEYIIYYRRKGVPAMHE